ncbi:hypothetical protein ACFPM7_29520 [Actinokineospora guangxiensis]|uniref:Secreted protein n=1 Tax=Actinokineospora guangxiensis TaxID=1490288 RepID=A0ABW0EYK9_9PSEU
MGTVQRRSGRFRHAARRALLAVALVAACLGISLTTTGTAQAASTHMCSSTPVPAGWVVTEAYTNQSICRPYIYYRISNDFYNGMHMCSATAVPAGWVVTEAYTNQGICGPYIYYRITSNLQNGMHMCSATAVPAGWIVTEAYTNQGICGPYVYYRIVRA